MSSSYNYNLTGTPHTIPPDRLIYHAYPVYYSPAPSLFPPLSDSVLAVLAPLPAYWLMSGFFHLLDCTNWAWVVRYRINPSSEVATRNRATRLEVLRAVLSQQAVQTALGVWWVTEHTQKVDHAGAMRGIAQTLASPLGAFEDAAAPLAYFLYWWFIPTVQLFVAMIVLDSWQYFLHRAMHLNEFLYKELHSIHHRLYVPYAYGTLYNHPIEGFILDSMGAMISESSAQLSPRQAMLFFLLTTCKAVDDHCGYRFPLDPFQHFSGATAEYHDIHHSPSGIKFNFAQPWFVHWDVILGTRITKQALEARRAKIKSL
ncbi:sphingosine hydroxylase [Russula earlei]|uniref:Sphingosine hydroxylase n=1 Tax=Russula earlei TaxID=71964 RepID=A0ACC0UIM3_9AGAM|nr:sphingosine hydroxylase [Russula earlei]